MNEENEREKRVEGVNSVEQKVDKIRKDEVRKALKRMKSGKAVGPDDIPVEVWKCLGEAAVEFLTSLFNRVLESERMPEEWRRSVLVPIFKNKGDVQSCSNYRGIKLMSRTMKLWERVVEARLRKVVEICEQQYGFMPRKSTTDAIFALRILMEKYRDGQRELHCVFVDLEKAYDRVPREELWYCMRKSGVAEKYVRVVQDMYERSRTVVRCAVGQTEEFKVEVGLHQGSALSPFLFAIVMDQLSEEVRQESPWTMMFADDIVICSESREQVEENLERWRFALERRGMKVSRSKTEYMCVNEREGSGTVRLQGEEVKKVQEFKYLGSTVQSNGECGKEVKKRVQAGWNGWRKVWGVLCDRKISARIKGKVYRTVVRPAMLYGLETVSLRKRQESELEVAELKMLRFPSACTKNMTLNIQSNCYNACYNRIPRTNADAKPRTISFLLLAAILGAETLITAALLYNFTRELHTANESLDHDVFPTECLHHQPAAMHGADLASCDFMRQELLNSMNTRLLLDIRNSLWQSLGENNITQAFKPAIHVGAKQELKQYHRLQRTGDSQDFRLMLECLNWEVLSGQNTQEGLMILSPDGEIVVPQDGIYFVYSQMNFVTSRSRPDLQLVQYLFKRTTSHPELMMLGKAGALSRRLDSESGVGLYSSHQGALFQLEQGDRLSLCVSNMDAVLLQPEATYFGAFIID
ncbi:hypothetical protein QTP70_025560 [Hemibagrus guttatus]|uniref:ribonuclease H n=1 Tax=Hemibagrus guttatus TaxID=175788 RepID=A0AAE0ULI2_9TELE|nr:hypothetical protein QTP70_025560 [Hemibagrus guttatus]